MDARNPYRLGLDVENPVLADRKDSGRLNGTNNAAPRAQVGHYGAASFAPPGINTTEMDPVFGNQVFNIQWALMIFWPLLIPIIVAVFLPLCNRAGRRFPTISYKRGWIGNLVMSVVVLVYWLLLIILSAVARSKGY